MGSIDRPDEAIDGRGAAAGRVIRLPIRLLKQGRSPRLSGIDRAHVRVLAELNSRLPPILVHHPTMEVIDGVHRLCAARLNGRDEIAARLFAGSAAQAFLLAVETNLAHGLTLSLAERKAAARAIIVDHPDWSDRRLGAATGLSPKTVAALRRRSTEDSPQLSERVGQDGRVRPLNNAEGRRIASEVIAARPDAPLREIAKAAGVSVGTAHDVRTRIRKGEDPLTRRRQLRTDAEPAGIEGEDSDVRLVLETLRRDPSLRYSSRGRSMLRWLDSLVLREEQVSALLNDVPPHSALLVAKLARHCATVWGRIAESIDEKHA
ncbi:ParB N-terminal domain-containing protein [Nonomuraea africana]|uniref:ParB-like chromosome segregation protein Spo0J n=1 Tax=Nonomuraea africana TaxID=46171 RepID=A0ABR9KNS2_9ACTN|nr:ParB N-terminal domain-containing protein [Nonomuraea africana]MBE1563671.1 ParB-like chromosome segregation protein Spo0J [Nonomuraea africana]